MTTNQDDTTNPTLDGTEKIPATEDCENEEVEKFYDRSWNGFFQYHNKRNGLVVDKQFKNTTFILVNNLSAAAEKFTQTRSMNMVMIVFQADFGVFCLHHLDVETNQWVIVIVTGDKNWGFYAFNPAGIFSPVLPVLGYKSVLPSGKLLFL